MQFFNQEHQVIGEFDADKNQFVKTVIGSQHKMRDPEGWAINSDIVGFLSTMGCKQINVIDEEAKITYTATVKDFRKYAVPGYGF